MMSNISFYKLVQEDIKRRVWLLWLYISVFLVVLPVMTAMQIDGMMHWSSNDMRYVRQWFIESQIGNNWVGFFLLAGAILGAVSSFSYLHSKRQVDFYYSLPVKREEWFLVSYVSSFIQIMVPCLVSYVMRYAIGAMKGVTSKESARAFLFAIVISVICYHLVYALSSVGMLLTGKILTGLLMIAFLQLWGAFVMSLKEMVMGTVFETYLQSQDGMLSLGSTSFYLTGEGWERSPILLYSNLMRRFFRKEHLQAPLFLMTMVGVGIILLALFLYKKRPSEAAGKSVAFPVLEPIIKVLLAISLGVFFANTAYSQYEAVTDVPIWAFGVGIVSTVFICLVVEFIYSADLKMVFRKKVSLGISVIGTVTICFILQFDVIGFDTYIPSKDKISAMSIDLYYNNQEAFEDSFSNEEESHEERLDKLRTSEFARIYKVAQNGVRHVGQKIDPWNDDRYLEVKTAYYLKNGKTVYRKYYVDYMEMYQCMDSLFADREYRKKYFNIDQLEKGTYNLDSIDMYLGTHHMFRSSKKNAEQLLEIYLEEMGTKPFSVFENANLVAQLHFIKNDRFMDFPIYEEFTKTLSFLKKKFPEWRELEAESISFITVEYSVPDSMDGEMKKKTVKRENIQEVLDSLCYVQTGLLGRIAEKDMYVTVETTMGHAHMYYIRKGQMPECLKVGKNNKN